MKYTRGDTVVGFEKLWFLQKRHAARYASTQVESPLDQNPSHSLYELAVKPILALLDQPSTFSDYSFYQSITRPEDREHMVQRLVFADAQNYINPTDFIQRNIHFFTPPLVEALAATVPALKLHKIPLQFPDTVSKGIITSLSQLLTDIDPKKWGGDGIRGSLAYMVSRGVKEVIRTSQGDIAIGENGMGEEMKALKLKLEKGWVKLIHQYLRWALVAGKPGPDSALTMELLGYEETGRRLAAAEEVLNGLKSDNVDGETQQV
jgi:glutamyl-tRNA synthetase